MVKLKTIIGLIVAVATPETVAAVKGAYRALAAMGGLLKDDGTPASPEELDSTWDEVEANLRTFKADREASQLRVAADIAGGR